MTQENDAATSSTETTTINEMPGVADQSVSNHKAESAQSKTFNITPYQRKLMEAWSASHDVEQQPAPFTLSEQGEAVWLNRKTRRMLAKRNRKR